MKSRFSLFRRASALALAAALSTAAAARAAEPAASPEAARQQDLDVLYQSLVRYHPDLFANTPESAFLARKAAIEARLASESDVDFVLDLQSLAALAGDSHTQVSMNAVAEQVRFYPLVLTWYDGHWYLTTAEQAHADLVGREVTAVNGHTMEQVLEWNPEYIFMGRVDNVELVMDDDTMHAVARKAMERKTGARGLRNIMEETLLNLMYMVPSDESITKVVITPEVVDGKESAKVVRRKKLTQ